MNNQIFQAARTQLEQLIHNNVDGKEKQEMLSLVKDMAAAMEAEQNVVDADFFCDGVDGSQRHRDVPR